MAKCEVCEKRIKKTDRLCPRCLRWQSKLNDKQREIESLTGCLTKAIKELIKARRYVRQSEKGEKYASKERQEPKGN